MKFGTPLRCNAMRYGFVGIDRLEHADEVSMRINKILGSSFGICRRRFSAINNISTDISQLPRLREPTFHEVEQEGRN